MEWPARCVAFRLRRKGKSQAGDIRQPGTGSSQISGLKPVDSSLLLHAATVPSVLTDFSVTIVVATVIGAPLSAVAKPLS